MMKKIYYVINEKFAKQLTEIHSKGAQMQLWAAGMAAEGDAVWVAPLPPSQRSN